MKQIDNSDLVDRLNNALELHERMRGEISNPVPATDLAKKRYAFAHTLTTQFIIGSDNYLVLQKTQCTTKKIKYALAIYKNGDKLRSDIRILQNLKKTMANGGQ